MYLLDTNVISELRKAKSNKSHQNVIAWAKTIAPSCLFLSVITILELEIGILLMERRDTNQGAILRLWLDTHVLPVFSERILPLDVTIAKQCAKLHVPNPQSNRDAIIAATALVHGMTVVTRNMSDFYQTGVEILNPWDHKK
jgi:toxin FitB